MIDLPLHEIHRIGHIAVLSVTVSFIFRRMRCDLHLVQHGVRSKCQKGIPVLHHVFKIIHAVICVHDTALKDHFVLRQLRTIGADILLRNIPDTTSLQQQFDSAGPAAVGTGLGSRQMDVQLCPGRPVYFQRQGIPELPFFLHGLLRRLPNVFLLIDHLDMPA